MAEVRFEGVRKEFKNGTVAVDDLWLEVPDGEFIILVGPSGCGKTTALRMVAGLEDVTRGEIVLGDEVVTNAEPGDRDVAMVFQNYALYPHMSVRDNMAFPLRMRSVPRKEMQKGVSEAARLLGLSELLDRKPHELSGGQRQRVAMGRAIVRHPQVFLLDEPLSNLDAKLRTQMRAELARLHRRLGVTTLYVTHDQTEAMTLGTRVAVFREGVMQQVGTPQQLYASPVNMFVGRFIGSPPMTLLSARIGEGKLDIPIAEDRSASEMSSRWPQKVSKVALGVRPEAWCLGTNGEEPVIAIRGEVEVIEELGSDAMAYCRLEGDPGDMAVDEEGNLIDTFAVRISGRMALRPGDSLRFEALVANLHVFDAGSGEALVSPQSREPVPVPTIADSEADNRADRRDK